MKVRLNYKVKPYSDQSYYVFRDEPEIPSHVSFCEYTYSYSFQCIKFRICGDSDGNITKLKDKTVCYKKILHTLK
jgi:hypothetical protein